MRNIEHIHTLGEAVEFIEEYRRGKDFKGWSSDEIAMEVLNASKANDLAVITRDGTEEIVGLIIFETWPTIHTLYVKHVLVAERGLLKRFLTLYAEHYPGWSIAAKRAKTGKVKLYTPTNLCLLLKT